MSEEVDPIKKNEIVQREFSVIWQDNNEELTFFHHHPEEDKGNGRYRICLADENDNKAYACRTCNASVPKGLIAAGLTRRLSKTQNK